ncbi:MAG: UDP-N-acetylmuramate dehydrogenase [Gammaproteobacteria bacterium]|nr:UDP-N-acetylmuramate dehydrogenase [Gammaproteobacteria bacterium]
MAQDNQIDNTTAYKGMLLKHEPMSRHTSWRVGGMADRFYRPTDINDLSSYLKSLPVNEPVFWLGLGSNVLVTDAGIRGTVICTSGVLNAVKQIDESRIYIEAGVPSPKLAKFSAKSGLAGAEFLSGIPGTFGGALKMNAGAVGGETWDIVESVETIDTHGEIHKRLPEEFLIAYRHVEAKEKSNQQEWFVSAIIKLTAGDKEESLQTIKKHLNRRSATQPTQQPNAGSVFRNPAGDYAARLIENCGLKNFCIGGACVSEKHANFIINTGTATAKDIESLINAVHKKVQQQHSVDLIREVQIVGEASGEYIE